MRTYDASVQYFSPPHTGQVFRGKGTWQRTTNFGDSFCHFMFLPVVELQQKAEERNKNQSISLYCWAVNLSCFQGSRTASNLHK
jgi:hypothetical protein